MGLGNPFASSSSGVRAFSPWDLRQQTAATLVYSEDDLSRLVTQCLVDGTRCVACVAASFDLTAPLTFDAALAGLELFGAPGTVLRCHTGTNPALTLNASHSSIRDLEIQSISSTGVAISISASANYVEIANIDFTPSDQTSAALFFATAVSASQTTNYFRVSGCSFQTQAGVSAASSFASVIEGCRSITSSAITFSDPFCSLGAVPTYRSNTGMSLSCSSSITRAGGVFVGNSSCNLTLGAHTGSVSIAGNSGATIRTGSSTGLNLLAGNPGATKLLHPTDIDDDAIGAGAVGWDLIPITDDGYKVGSPTFRFADGYFDNFHIKGQLQEWTTTGTVATTDGTAATAHLIGTVSGVGYYVEADVIGRQTNGINQTNVYKLGARVKNTAGLLASSVTQILVLEEVAAWDATIDTSGISIRVRVTGAAATNINWGVIARVRQI